MAQTTALIALDFARQSGVKEDIFKACLLLARIYATNGRYSQGTSFFAKAKKFIDEADEILAPKSANDELDFLLTQGKVCYLEEKYQEANKLYDICLNGMSVKPKGLRLARVKIDQSHSNIQLGAYDLALKGTIEAEQLLKKNETTDVELQIDILHSYSLIFVKKHDYTKALEYAQTLIELSRKNDNRVKELIGLNVTAIVSGVKGNFKIAAQYFQEALSKSEKIGYRYYIAQCLINIATIYAHLYNYEDAIERYIEVLKNYGESLDDQTKVAIYNNVGNIHFTNQQYKKAEPYFEDALKLARDQSFKIEEGLALAQLSRTKNALNDLDQSEKLAQEAADILAPLGNINGKQINLINLGEIQFQKKDFAKAIELVQEGIDTAAQLQDDISQISGFLLLSKIYGEKGNFQKAFETQSTFVKMKEAFIGQQRNKQFLDLEIKNAIKQKQLEIEQLTKENELQSLLLEKTDQIERQNGELISMNEDLRQFAYIASHDLKEPLRMISSYAQILLRMYGDKFDDNAKSYFGYMTEGVTRMNELLEALLKYATVGRTEEEIEEIELDYIAEICRVNLRVLIEETKAEITYGELPVVKTTRSMIIQLMQNLISNAIKFRAEGVQPKVEITSLELEEEHRISVKDNGIGIDKENQERIFVIFQRLNGRSAYEGTGIGLAICQKIVQRLGGRLWVDSEPGKGSTFHFTVPK